MWTAHTPPMSELVKMCNVTVNEASTAGRLGRDASILNFAVFLQSNSTNSPDALNVDVLDLRGAMLLVPRLSFVKNRMSPLL
jgi:hypothetical protein